MTSRNTNIILALVLFIVAFLAGPLEQLARLTMMPGNIGDARLNNYFLENIYQFLKGASPSLVHLSFFYPFPYILGFSDNLFGSSPVYLLARALTAQPDTAFQIWYLAGYLFNYVAAYYALRKFELSTVAATVGALIFAFALPVSAHSGHAQLHYRFGVPLTITLFTLFLAKQNWRYFTLSAAWLVWQFYCTIYIGFFTLLVLVAITGIYIVNSTTSIGNIKSRLNEFIEQWCRIDTLGKVYIAVSLSALLGLMVILFYPYLQVTHLYDAKRSLSEVASMLPRPQSYFLSDSSWLWSSSSKIFANLPMRHEHQMFVGVVPMLLAIMGVFSGSSKNNGFYFRLLSGSLGFLMLLTLYLGGFSLWFFLAKLPLASAIRAFTRIDLVFLFLVAYLGAVATDKIREKAIWANKFIFLLLIPFLIFEFSATSLPVSSKLEWRNRLTSREGAIPVNLPKHPILFFAQQNGPFYADELDAMWLSLGRNHPTLNGYSGLYPPHYAVEYGTDCSELPKRIQSFLQFNSGKNDLGEYRQLAERVVPIGFANCNPEWLKNSPPFSTSKRAYTAEEFRALSMQYVGRAEYHGRWFVTLKIVNTGEMPISAASATNNPIRISWRFIDAKGSPLTGWDTRKDLPFDIPANGNLDISVPIDLKAAEKGKTLEISLVQENVFWGHDIGIAPLQVAWQAN